MFWRLGGRYTKPALHATLSHEAVYLSMLFTAWEVVCVCVCVCERERERGRERKRERDED